MKLYYTPGSCSMAPHIALRLVGADFDLIKVDTETQKTETGVDFSKINPKGYVPALNFEGDEILTEAAAILQFIADQNPEAEIAPKPGTLERARVQELLSFVGSELHKKAFGPFFSANPPEGDARKISEAFLAKRLATIEDLLSDGRPFLTGEKFSIADAYFFVVTNWVNFIDVSLKPWPHISAYMDRVAATEPVRAAMKYEGLLN